MKQYIDRLKEFILKNWKWIILIICITCFALLIEDVLDEDIGKWDILGYDIVSVHLHSNFVTTIIKFITNFGGALFLIVLTVLLFIIIKNKKIGICVTSNLIIVTLLNILLKNILQRPRPVEYRIIDETRL